MSPLCNICCGGETWSLELEGPAQQAERQTDGARGRCRIENHCDLDLTCRSLISLQRKMVRLEQRHKILLPLCVCALLSQSLAWSISSAPLASAQLQRAPAMSPGGSSLQPVNKARRAQLESPGKIKKKNKKNKKKAG